MKNVTIVVPCYNEEKNIDNLYERLKDIIHSLADYKFHILFVNDGSKDNTLNKMQNLRELDPNVSYLSLSRNFGKENAMLAGLDFAEGEAVILIDADLQDPPELIPQMIEEWEKGYDDVYARRRSRAGETWFKKASAHWYYRILQKFADIDIPADVGDFRLLDRQAVDALCSLRERQRYTKGLFSWIGYNKKELLFDREPRAAGNSKMNFLKLFGLAVDGITSFSVAPLRLASILGIIISSVAFMYLVFVVVKTLLFGDPVAGYPSMISIILFMGGIQLIVLGIIGEYVGRIFNEAKHRPDYLVSEYNGKKILRGKK
ncbi:Glycosyltransferase involved in cell wall bisynthesis [Succiniclasticum ruminis]|uniref:Glycosyltransferase involved in cell wall bisynthesis n=1 Tax=Succiniclasticum ruminis TaxID=40841 RepID=A0A1G6I1Z5_9FIRM|nr:glycosyltransferase family 2 protein [Succiniclasticum ruminis]SDC00460.1 Glycosyltransferase involved in cell wall bisynthesis [Succiniclasticum ruminis]